MPRPLQSPDKELRFTRSGQAAGFWLAAAVLACVAVTVLACALYRDVNPRLPHPAWALLPLALALLTGRTALRLTRHAYLILTPLGIEVFPFFRPAKFMRLVTWQEIVDAEIDANLTLLTLHHDAQRSSGLHLSLAPIREDRRELLAKAVAVRVFKPASRSS
ncbi:MAG: hypothetical protein DVB26_04635 [Verrucomicrobia bacterium]|nr:MAG: hypothetical protein DVB26_04635 [Verrucomicrobiota bacterium]